MSDLPFTCNNPHLCKNGHTCAHNPMNQLTESRRHKIAVSVKPGGECSHYKPASVPHSER
jgi:hypothetical protein